MQPTAFVAQLDETSATLSVSGEVDDASTADLRAAIAAAVDACDGTLAVDLDAVTFLPSAAIGSLVTARQDAAARGRSVDLLAAPGTIAQRILQVCAIPYRSS